MNINEVMNEELISVNTFGCSPGTSHQVDQNDSNNEAVGLSASSLSFNNFIEEDIDDPADPDFMLSNTDETNNSLVNSSSNSVIKIPIESLRSNEADKNLEIIQRKRKKRPDKYTWNVVVYKK